MSGSATADPDRAPPDDALEAPAPEAPAPEAPAATRASPPPSWPPLPDLWAAIQARRLEHHPRARCKPFDPERAKALKAAAQAAHRAGYTAEQLVDAVTWLYTSPCHTAECCRSANGGDPTVALLRSPRGKGGWLAVLYVEAMLDEQAGPPPVASEERQRAGPTHDGRAGSHTFRARQFDADLGLCFTTHPPAESR